MEPITKVAYDLYSEMLFVGRQSISGMPNPMMAAADYLEVELGGITTVAVRDVYEVMLEAERICLRATQRVTFGEMKVVADRVRVQAIADGVTSLDDATDWERRIENAGLLNPTYDEAYAVLMLMNTDLAAEAKRRLDVPNR